VQCERVHWVEKIKKSEGSREGEGESAANDRLRWGGEGEGVNIGKPGGGRRVRETLRETERN